MNASEERANALKIVEDLEHLRTYWTRINLSQRECDLLGRAIGTIGNLIGLIDIITAPPMTPEEAEAALDDLPELDEADKAAMASIDFDKILKYATGPTNASPECMVRELALAGRRAPYFDKALLQRAEAWLDRRFS